MTQLGGKQLHTWLNSGAPEQLEGWAHWAPAQPSAQPRPRPPCTAPALACQHGCLYMRHILNLQDARKRWLVRLGHVMLTGMPFPLEGTAMARPCKHTHG